MAALSSAITDLLNKFADSQPALRLPNEPYESSNPQLGSAINAAIAAVAAGSADIGASVAGGTPGRLLFVGSGSILAQDSNIVWDNTNKRLGLGTATPSNPFQLVHAGASGTAMVIQGTNAALTGNGITVQHYGTGNGMLIQPLNSGRGLYLQSGASTTGKMLEILSNNAANTNPMAVMTGTHAGYGLTITTNAGTAQNYTATFNNLSTGAAAPVSGGVYGSVRSTQVLSAGVVGEVIGSGTGSGFFAVRNAAGTCLALGTNLGAGVRLSAQYAMNPANNYALEFPLAQGAADQVLINDGLGVFSWAYPIPNGTPASAVATGIAGQIKWDADYIYVCTATDTWKRAAIATW